MSLTYVTNANLLPAPSAISYATSATHSVRSAKTMHELQTLTDRCQVTDRFYCDNCDSPTKRKVIAIPIVREFTHFTYLCQVCLLELATKLAQADYPAYRI